MTIEITNQRELNDWKNNPVKGSLNFRDWNDQGYVDLRKATIEGDVYQYFTQDDINFLRELPIDSKVFNIDDWHSNDLWEKSKTVEELHTCGTAHCIRGYAEALYLVENGKKVEDANTLYPNLKYMFHMSDGQFRKERQRVLNNYKDKT